MKKNIKINLPEDVIYILNRLNQAGFEAFAVGGCVRDAIIGNIPNDWDITTSAIPEEIKEIFDKTYDTGIEHGTITVVIEKENYEVTTFRIDGEYKDHRRPSDVVFTSNIIEDLKRRDFTINAMAYHPEKGLIDPFEGQKDLELKLIKCVGKATERFEEDALRMLRAIRFSAKLNFEIEEATLEAVKQRAETMTAVSKERVREELNKLLISNHPEKFLLLHDVGLMKYILPDFEKCIGVKQNHPYHVYEVHDHIIRSMALSKKDLIIRWTMLLHDIGKPAKKTTDAKGIDHFHGHVEESLKLAANILKDLKFDNYSMKRIMLLIEYHDERLKADTIQIKELLSKIGLDVMEILLEVQKADILAQNPTHEQKGLNNLEAIKKVIKNIVSTNQCYTIKDLEIDGNKIKSLGVREGKQIGLVLNHLLKVVIQYPEKNTENQLIEIAKKYLDTLQ